MMMRYEEEGANAIKESTRRDQKSKRRLEKPERSLLKEVMEAQRRRREINQSRFVTRNLESTGAKNTLLGSKCQRNSRRKTGN